MEHVATPPVALSIAGASARYGLTRTYIYAELAAGRLEARKAGRRTLILTASLDRLMASLPAARFRKTAA